MKAPINTDGSDLEAEYIRVKVTLYKKLFLCIAVLTLVIIIMETLRAFFYAKLGIFFVLSLFVAFGSLVFHFIWRLEKNQELSITIYITIFFLSVLFAQYYTDSGYFDTGIDGFNFAYAFAVCERLLLARISKFSHRTGFAVVVTFVRVFGIYTGNMALFVMQFVYLFFTIYLDMDKEKYDRNFFLTYFRNKEQLLKFKNLVVQDIPESIIIISQDLTQPLFVNNSFEELVADRNNLSIRDKLRQFMIHESLENSRIAENSIMNNIPLQRQNLLVFLESTIHQQNSLLANQKFSCNLIYKKTIKDLQGENQRNQEYMFEAKAIHLLWDEQPAIAVVLHDITQQHTILSLKLADAHKDTILATVSHELRTPLNGILGMVQIMEKRIRDNDMLNYLNICKNSADLLLSLVNSILDLNQIRAKKLKLVLEEIRVSELLNSIVSLFDFQCSQKGLYLKINIASNSPRYITTDKNRLRQILINLVGNAIKFTRTGGITISVYNSSDPENVTFSVEDTGAGIKDEDKHKLFRTFGKLEQSDKNVNPHGVGLGLTISDKLARLLDNNQRREGIRLESKFGKGSVFTFSVKKWLRDPSDASESDEADSNTDLPKRLVDEKGGVQSKMINYSREYAQSSLRSPVRSRLINTNSFTSPSQVSFPSIFQIDRTPTRRYNNSQSLPQNIHTQISDSFTESGIVPHVLIVDDNPLNTVIAECLIGSHGYKVKTALYGQVAIDIILNCNYAKEPIKLVLMDCQMPGMDGFMITKILKKMMVEKKIPEIPIVALTANDGEADKEATREAGMCEHITKPLKEVELVRILNKYMKR